MMVIFSYCVMSFHFLRLCYYETQDVVMRLVLKRSVISIDSHGVFY